MRALLTLALLASCGEPSSGLDLTALDLDVDPCTDFYRFACGGWIADHPVSADAAQESRFSQPFYAAVPRLWGIVLAADPRSADYGERLIGRHYEACLAAPTSPDGRAVLKRLVG